VEAIYYSYDKLARMEMFFAESILRGYHIYKDITWSQLLKLSFLAKERRSTARFLCCHCNESRCHDRSCFKVYISIFLQRGGVICYEITCKGNIPPQGGLELPCKLKFSAASKEITKIQKLPIQVPKSDEVTKSNTSVSPSKLATVEVKSCCDSVLEPLASSLKLHNKTC